jgi:3-oxocholest-4-en-26-oyl-CoA dehydrogenase beta subunit
VIADFSYGEAQVELQRAARELFAQRSPSSAVRATEQTDAGYQPDLWREMADLGWLGTGLPGDGRARFLDLYALCEEMGRALVASPLIETVGVAAEVLAAAGTQTQRQAVLPAVAEGTGVVAVMVDDGSGGVGRSGVHALADGDGWRLDGSCPLVAFASTAGWFLCAATPPSGGSPTLFLVDAASAGVSATPLPAISGVPLSRVEFTGVAAPAASVVGRPGEGLATLSGAVTRAAVLQTAQIVGAAHAVLEMTNRYAGNRVQFGIPIGKNQAVQYMVSDVLIDLHTTDLLGRQAAYRIDAGLDHEWQAEVAIVHGKVAAAHLHRQAHEVHAGVGFMVEHPLNLFSRRSKYWENNLGDARYHYEQVARLLCDAPAG